MEGNYNGKPKASYDLTNKGIEKHPGSSDDLLTDELFGYMSASLNTNLFSKVERENICISFANVKITKVTFENGIETITGTYRDIEKIYQRFQDLHQRKQESRERLHSGLNGSLEFGEKEPSVNVSSAQYEYFNHVCLQEIEELKQRFCVRIDCSDHSDGMSSLHFIALHDGGQVEKARQSYVDHFQKIIGDWSQEVIELADQSHLADVTKMLNEKYKRILTKKTANSLILRGPKQELLERAVSNVSKKIINLKDFQPTGKLSSLIKSLENQFCEVSFQLVGETLIITGLLPRVMDAEKSLNRLLRRDLSHMRNVPIDSESKRKDSDLARENSSPIKKSEAAAIEEQTATCPICLEIPTKKMTLDKCKHEFCEQCLKTAMLHKPVCPVCNTPYGVVIGDQPDGRMAHYCTPDKLPGYHCGTIVIDYSIPDGIQGAKHPNPGQRFQGAHRRAYLPDNDEGRDILHLLKKAFNQKLIFTIGQSRTTGTSNTVTWNDIHHKTSMHGGPQSYGYPDLEYLKRVRDELKVKGIQ